ncbi:AbrB/MazE/SpoVT family DNA-binding domain-containing protein [Prosthecobacter vanneervenii]|uniref:Bifunctional DNA-binding transcriptional regulator/antitoxin component of YhaV-PrlF toxin-antitoxin module n=1 Tax=Prosthecobacter vanneervenii TaxID=48466 RepID=A0A7W7YAK7_9BACT|nr:AbrB/MazE/SpoVT family DNA-binding domain-containing protein [Prosthecobacter vanneervenii]MBB5032666.1 bifunctional DNA-binding transcriptional regulator/antitoxin component of YhaV-PrlF toxin-antitoxin module [Prosthecobacter vanneervenii]
MTATLTIDETGQINLPESLRRVFGAQPGLRLRAEVTKDRIEIVKDVPVVTETMRSASGRPTGDGVPVVTAGELKDGVLLLPKLGIKMDAGAAVRADRDEHAVRALRR